MSEIISAVSKTVWGVPMLILVCGSGIYYTVRLGFLQIGRFKEWTGATFGTLLKKDKVKKGEVSPRRAVFAALASSIGTGNIVGVATAITAGGAGAIFWMWVSAFFGMAIKFAEIVLAIKFRRKGRNGFYGGPMYYIEKGLGKGYRPLAVFFSLAGAVACIGMGAMSQSNTISYVMRDGLNIPTSVSGIALALVAFTAISGGIAKISKISEFLVPVMAGLYLIGGVAIIFISPLSSYNAICTIFREAITPRAVYGGAAGEMLRRAVRYGVARGVFSNEAGLGSAPIIHASANVKSAVNQGFWGMFEVFVDTILVCSITAIAILASGIDLSISSGAGIVTLAFSEFFGSFGGAFVGGATVLFALATILGWSYYGEMCVFYLIPREGSKKVYRIIFAASVFLGAIAGMEEVWEIADMANGLMMIPNIIALILLSPTVIREAKNPC